MTNHDKAYRAELTEVDAQAVEPELAKLWREAAEGPVPALTRVILSNVLVYSSTQKDAGEAMAVIADVIADHPSRAVVVDDEPREEPEPGKAEVSMVCSIGERGRRLCGEVIRIHSHGGGESVLGTVMPVMIPDMPTFLWTPSDLTWDRGFMKRLLQISDHWVIDSRKFSDRAGRFAMAEALVNEDVPQVVISDLPWTSLYSWREAMARMFDDHNARAYLSGVREVRVCCRFGSDGLPDVSGILIAVWLMCTLDWRLSEVNSEDGSWAVKYESDNGAVRVLISPTDTGRCSLQSVTIEAEHDGRHATFQAKLTEQQDAVQISATAPDVTGVPYAARLLDGALRDELDIVLNSPSPDMLYRPMLRGIADLTARMQR